MRRLTPEEIFHKDFRQSIRGYDVNEVNEFLDVVIRNYEELIQENEYLKEQMKSLKQTNRQSTGRQNTIPKMTQYDAVINEILNRLDRLEKMIR